MPFELLVGIVVTVAGLGVGGAIALRARAQRVRLARLERWQKYTDAELLRCWRTELQDLYVADDGLLVERVNRPRNSLRVTFNFDRHIGHNVATSKWKAASLSDEQARLYWLEYVEAARKKPPERLPRLAGVVEVVADTLLPARINDEQLGDLIERRDKMHREGRNRWRVTLWFAVQVAWAFYGAIVFKGTASPKKTPE